MFEQGQTADQFFVLLHGRLRVTQVTSEGQQVVQMVGFHYGARIPIQTSPQIAANGTIAPAFNYESTGLATDISMRESEPVIVGTLRPSAAA